MAILATSILVLALAQRAAGATPSAAVAQVQETAAVLVQVTDETGNPVPDTEVFVVISDGQQVVAEMSGITEADGSVAFADIGVAEGYTALAVTSYEGSPYQGERTPLVAGQQAIAAISVFNSSGAEGNLHIDILHIVMSAVDPSLFQAIQVMSVLNVGQMASLAGPEIDGQRAGLIIPLPSGVSNAQPIPQMSGLDPAALRVEADRMLHFRPVPPGNAQIAIAYDIIAGEDGVELALTVPYPTAQVSLLVGPGLETIEVSSAQLQELQPEEIPGQGVYSHWTSDVLNSGETLRFRIGPRRQFLSTGAWALLLLAVALLAVVGVSLWSTRPKAAAPQPLDRAALIAEVARLDAARQAGRIDDATYQARRAEAIATLTRLDRNSAGGGSDSGE